MNETQIKDDLLEIGSTFKTVYPPNLRSTNPNFSFWSYKVISHQEVRENNRVRWGNRLEPIDVEYHSPIGFVNFDRKLYPIPPRHILEYCSDDVKAIVRGVDAGIFELTELTIN